MFHPRAHSEFLLRVSKGISSSFSSEITFKIPSEIPFKICKELNQFIYKLVLFMNKLAYFYKKFKIQFRVPKIQNINKRTPN